MKVAIVGGGFSGIAVAINLLQSADQDVSIVVIEKGNSVGKLEPQRLELAVTPYLHEPDRKSSEHVKAAVFWKCSL